MPILHDIEHLYSANLATFRQVNVKLRSGHSSTRKSLGQNMLLAYNTFVSYVESDGDSETHLVLLSKFDTYICIPPANTSWNTAQSIHHCPGNNMLVLKRSCSILAIKVGVLACPRGQLDLVEDNHTICELQSPFILSTMLCSLCFDPNTRVGKQILFMRTPVSSRPCALDIESRREPLGHFCIYDQPLSIFV